MVVHKVINNNIISAYDEAGQEVVMMGRGLGFGKKPGTPIDETKIEKTFYIKSQGLAEQFKELLRNMPLENVRISNDVISYAEKDLKLKLNQSIYVTLTDHINFAIANYKIYRENALLWEIKRFYDQEYHLGKYAVSLIKERLHIDLPDDEAGFIALHFVNAEYGTQIQEVLKFPHVLNDIFNIVKTEMQGRIKEDSVHYERFVTHVKFLLQRIYRDELLEEECLELEDMLCRKYPEAYDCSLKVADYIEKETKVKLPKAEIMYSMIHIHRITGEEKKEEENV